MDCAEMQFGYGQGRRNGNRVAYNKLEWTASFSSYFAYGQGVHPDTASYFWCAPPASFGAPKYELNRCYRNYLTGSSRITYRLVFYLLKQEGVVNLNRKDEGGPERGDLSIADIYEFHKPSTNNPKDVAWECPIVNANFTEAFMDEAIILHDETIECSGSKPQATCHGSIDLEGTHANFVQQSGTQVPLWSRATTNRIMCSVAATAFNQNGIQNFDDQWPRAWVNTRLYYTDE